MKKSYHKKIMAVLILITLLGMAIPWGSFAQENDYENHWAKPMIERALEAGILKGYLDGTVRPDNSITRAEFFSMVNNAFHFTATKSISYADVEDYMWYAPVFKKAAAAGYLEKTDNYIRPSDLITREEVAIYLSVIKSLDRAVLNSGMMDLNQASTKGKAAILSILETGIMTGTPENMFYPKSEITRAQALTAIIRAVDYDSGNLSFLEPKTYGSEKVSQLVSGNVLIRSKDVVLQNLDIAGDLIIQKEIDGGTVTLKNSTVKGTIYVYGGELLMLIDDTVNEIVVDNEVCASRLEARGTTVVDRLSATTDITLTEGRAYLSEDGFTTVIVKSSTVDGMNVNLTGAKLKLLQIENNGVLVLTDSLTEIKKLDIYGENTRIKGNGFIERAYIKGSGTVFDIKPYDWEVHPGVKLPKVMYP